VARHSLDRWLLVNYAGYPYAPNSLMPDNGLANLAGALLADGREVEILDYGTVDTLRRLADPALRPRLAAAWRALRRGRRSPWALLQQLQALVALRRCEAARTRRQERVVAEIAAEVVARVRARGIQAVGCKLWNGDGIEGSAAIAEAVRRECPGVRLFGGGPQMDIFTDLVPAVYPVFDVLVYGEGEETIVALAAEGDDPAAWPSLPNLVYRDGNTVRSTASRHVADLDRLPLPAYAPAVYPAMRGNEKIKIIVVDESRGCRNECAFCIHPVKSDRQMRLKSVPRLLAELDHFGHDPGVHTFRFAGSCTPYALLNAFAAEVVRSGRQVAYASFAHVRDSAEADFALLRRSGCEALFFGIESGSQRVLDRMHKGTTVAAIRDTLQRVRSAGVFAVGSLIAPAPGDDETSLSETLALVAEARPDAVTLQAPVVTPRTDWYEHPERYGIRFRDREAYRRQGLHWKAKLLLPPTLWGDVPVEIDGRGYREILRRTQSFGQRLAALHIPTGISDDLCLMSRRTGQDPCAFRDEAIEAFFTGDADAVAALVERINARA
jgi:radical SAM superfamily enzyme YgiQ (UPF0313 family)